MRIGRKPQTGFWTVEYGRRVRRPRVYFETPSVEPGPVRRVFAMWRTRPARIG